MIARAAIALLALAPCGCRSEGDSGKVEPGSCYRERDNACTEYGASEAAAGKRMCVPGVFRSGAASCPTENRLGTCKHGDKSEWMYGGPPNRFTADSAKSSCESANGVFFH